jgi:hypothetical protein
MLDISGPIWDHGEMEGVKKRRRIEWRAAGRRKAEHMIWLLALIGTLAVIGVTLIAGHLRKEAGLSGHLDGPISSAGAGDESQ